MATTIIALDVDGVINCFPKALPESEKPAWDDLRTFMAGTPDLHGGRKFEITVSQQLLDTLLALHKSPAAEIHWLTTWGAAANGELSQGLGWPGDFKVAGERPWNAAYTPLQTNNVSYEGQRGWWKFACMLRLADENPDSRIVWIDDDLAFDGQASAWVKEQGDRVLGISPDTDQGITPAQLALISRFVTKEG